MIRTNTLPRLRIWNANTLMSQSDASPCRGVFVFSGMPRFTKGPGQGTVAGPVAFGPPSVCAIRSLAAERRRAPPAGPRIRATGSTTSGVISDAPAPASVEVGVSVRSPRFVSLALAL